MSWLKHQYEVNTVGSQESHSDLTNLHHVFYVSRENILKLNHRPWYRYFDQCTRLSICHQKFKCGTHIDMIMCVFIACRLQWMLVFNIIWPNCKKWKLKKSLYCRNTLIDWLTIQDLILWPHNAMLTAAWDNSNSIYLLLTTEGLTLFTKESRAELQNDILIIYKLEIIKVKANIDQSENLNFYFYLFAPSHTVPRL